MRYFGSLETLPDYEFTLNRVRRGDFSAAFLKRTTSLSNLKGTFYLQYSVSEVSLKSFGCNVLANFYFRKETSLHPSFSLLWKSFKISPKIFIKKICNSISLRWHPSQPPLKCQSHLIEIQLPGSRAQRASQECQSALPQRLPHFHWHPIHHL